MKKILITIGLILGIGGIIFSLLPGDVHMAMFGGSDSDMGMEGGSGGMESMEGDDHTDEGHHNHGAFVTNGLIVAVIGLGLAFAGWKLFD
tara:strand:+ start:61 stop:330 length:270 start_codon:yes stop_codon:yes gene_type:complete